MNKLYSALRLHKGLLTSLVAVAALTACSSGKWGFPYKAPLQQGNWVTAEQVALLQPGMSSDQVRYALGSPTLIDMFHPNRWEYAYYFKPGYGDPVLRKFTVWFDENGLLRHWEGDPQPNFQPSDFATQQQWKGDKVEEMASDKTSGMTITPLQE
ncbi:outer membrane protein assembly factor BamE [Pelistega sp. NLN82]|uniref:Outer membrane protein assembly factor BamE n=1 Tax=Pelistega ratti TaxID=2652177 RepID=A0A6L9Y5B2_9BURK|nr:outer membrane protein assembly factor BamE [Pelistega ratti]NEN75004.1 outer membrane protein assembly factor BamE [Pelistega ratti]